MLLELLLKQFPHSLELWEEYCLNSFEAGEGEKCFEISNKILSFKNIDDNFRLRAYHNRWVSTKFVIDKHTSYNESIVNKLVGIVNKEEFPLVTFTITSCKRFDLFQKTVNSFLNCCTDIEKISKWFCVDDNSSEEDRKSMKEKYPFFDFYFKEEDEKGHVKSMNLIKRNVKTPYTFHIEDDWQFYEKRNYISECLEILSTDTRIGQCLINKNYAEIPGDKTITGGILKRTNSGLRFYIHDQVITNKDKEEWFKRHKADKNNVKHCNYWPHFSFRPSLLKTKILNEVGDFKENTHNFEMDYANRYISIGYKSAFLENIYCKHIGRLTTDRFNDKVKNAYELNKVKQFYDSDKNVIQKFLINLESRKDRLENFQKQVDKIGIEDVNIFKAVNGKLLVTTPQLQRIFDGNDYDMRRGIVGCAMSHIKLYINLINSKYKNYLIFEDDLEFIGDFNKKLNYVMDELKGKDWDLVYLGHHQRIIDDKVYEDKLPNVDKWSTSKSLLLSLGGTTSYIISKNGAKKLLENINNTGMTNAIDTIHQKLCDKMNIYYCTPHLVKSECYRGNNSIDSDIQYNFDSLTLPIEDRLREEILFYKDKNSLILLEDKNVEKDKNYYYRLNNKKELDEFVKLCKENSKKHYLLDNKIIIIIGDDKNYNRYFHRFKKNPINGYNIDDCLIYKNK